MDLHQLAPFVFRSIRTSQKGTVIDNGDSDSLYQVKVLPWSLIKQIVHQAIPTLILHPQSQPPITNAVTNQERPKTEILIQSLILQSNERNVVQVVAAFGLLRTLDCHKHLYPYLDRSVDLFLEVWFHQWNLVVQDPEMTEQDRTSSLALLYSAFVDLRQAFRRLHVQAKSDADSELLGLLLNLMIRFVQGVLKHLHEVYHLFKQASHDSQPHKREKNFWCSVVQFHAFASMVLMEPIRISYRVYKLGKALPVQKESAFTLLNRFMVSWTLLILHANTQLQIEDDYKKAVGALTFVRRQLAAITYRTDASLKTEDVHVTDVVAWHQLMSSFKFLLILFKSDKPFGANTNVSQAVNSLSCWARHASFAVLKKCVHALLDIWIPSSHECESIVRLFLLHVWQDAHYEMCQRQWTLKRCLKLMCDRTQRTSIRQFSIRMVLQFLHSPSGSDLSRKSLRSIMSAYYSIANDEDEAIRESIAIALTYFPVPLDEGVRHKTNGECKGSEVKVFDELLLQMSRLSTTRIRQRDDYKRETDVFARWARGLFSHLLNECNLTNIHLMNFFNFLNEKFIRPAFKWTVHQHKNPIRSVELWQYYFRQMYLTSSVLKGILQSCISNDDNSNTSLKHQLINHSLSLCQKIKFIRYKSNAISGVGDTLTQDYKDEDMLDWECINQVFQEIASIDCSRSEMPPHFVAVICHLSDRMDTDKAMLTSHPDIQSRCVTEDLDDNVIEDNNRTELLQSDEHERHDSRTNLSYSFNGTESLPARLPEISIAPYSFEDDNGTVDKMENELDDDNQYIQSNEKVDLGENKVLQENDSLLITDPKTDSFNRNEGDVTRIVQKIDFQKLIDEEVTPERMKGSVKISRSPFNVLKTAKTGESQIFAATLAPNSPNNNNSQASLASQRELNKFGSNSNLKIRDTPNMRFSASNVLQVTPKKNSESQRTFAHSCTELPTTKFRANSPHSSRSEKSYHSPPAHDQINQDLVPEKDLSLSLKCSSLKIRASPALNGSSSHNSISRNASSTTLVQAPKGKENTGHSSVVFQDKRHLTDTLDIQPEIRAADSNTQTEIDNNSNALPTSDREQPLAVVMKDEKPEGSLKREQSFFENTIVIENIGTQNPIILDPFDDNNEEPTRKSMVNDRTDYWNISLNNSFSEGGPHFIKRRIRHAISCFLSELKYNVPGKPEEPDMLHPLVYQILKTDPSLLIEYLILIKDKASDLGNAEFWLSCEDEILKLIQPFSHALYRIRLLNMEKAKLLLRDQIVLQRMHFNNSNVSKTISQSILLEKEKIKSRLF